MRVLILLLACLAVATALKTEITKSKFGAIEYTTADEESLYKEVYFPDESIYYDSWQTVAHLEDVTKQGEINQKKKEDGTLYKCDDDVSGTDYFQFAPVFLGQLYTDD